MARPIREIPTLTGQTAIDFLTEAAKYDHLPVPHLTPEQEEEIRKSEEAYKYFVW